MTENQNLLSEDNSYIETERFIEHFTRDKYNKLFEGKTFVCKGKHQYSNIGGEWKCQCGRNVND